MRLGTVALAALVAAPAAVAQPAGTKPIWVYAHDFRVRKAGAKEFAADTPKVGVEVFRDEPTGAVIAVSQAGALAVTPVFSPGADKGAKWLFAHDLKARTADQERFTADVAGVGVEAFRDGPSGKLLYVSQKGLAFADLPPGSKADQDPSWRFGLVLKVRGPAEPGFGKGTKRFGIEAFADGNTGGLLYVTETGSIAAAGPAPAAPAGDAVKAPTALYGLTLRVRKAGQQDFSKETPTVGVEVFRDENTGGLLYISDTGALAAAPAPPVVETGKGVQWKAAMELKARPGGQADFGKAAQYGVEVFRDNNTGYTVFAADTGGIAVLAGK